MKVYLLEVSYYGDWSVYGIYSTWDLAEKHGIKAIDGDTEGSAYYIEPMEVITE